MIKPTALLLLLLATAAANAEGASDVPEQTAGTPSAKGSIAKTSAETDLATASLGAVAETVTGRTQGFEQLLAGQREAVAVLTSAVAVDWGVPVKIARIGMKIAGGSEGRLVLVALNEAGEKVDLSSRSGAKKLITDRAVDGNESIVMIDAGQIRARAVMFVWTPLKPGEPLVLTQLAILTQEKTRLPQGGRRNALQPTIPVVPTPSEVAAVRLSLAREEAKVESLAPLPEPIPPYSRAISH